MVMRFPDQTFTSVGRPITAYAGAQMKLLFAVINDPNQVDDILAGFIELGVRGATILKSEGMGSVLSHEIPIFAGLETLLSKSRPQNRTIVSILTDEQVEPVLQHLQKVCGDLERPGKGIATILDLDQVVGLAPPLADPSDEPSDSTTLDS